MLQDSEAFSGFSVDDLAGAKEFYGQTLGLRLTESPMGLTLELAGGGKVFVYGKSDHQPASYTVLNFPVADIDTTVEELVGKGVTFERYEGFAQDEKAIARSAGADMGPDIAWFKDPAGNILSVLSSAGM